MKKIISMFLMTCICTMLIMVSASAQNEPTIKLSSASGKTGDTVDVTISLENNPGLIAMRLYVSYDKDALTLTGVNDSGNLTGKQHSPEYAAYPYTLYWENATASEDITVNGVLTTLSFQIKSGATAGSYPISVSYDNSEPDIFNFYFNPVDFAVVNGSVTVIAGTGGSSGPSGGGSTEPEPVKEYSITPSNVQIGNTISLDVTLTTPDTYAGKIIFAAYDKDGRLVDAKIYNAAASIEDISISKGTATSAKLFWWNMDTLDAYCKSVPVAIN